MNIRTGGHCSAEAGGGQEILLMAASLSTLPASNTLLDNPYIP